MCGRFTFDTPLTQIADPLGLDPAVVAAFLDQHPTIAHPRYNIAPTQSVAAIVRTITGDRRLHALRWGLVPHWAKASHSGASTINARSESAHEKPTFRDAFAGLGTLSQTDGMPERGRCLIPADGFYEWKPPPPGVRAPKKPMLARLGDGSSFVMAGLYDTWSPSGAASSEASSPGTDAGDGKAIMTAAVLTCDANPLLATTHPRMPVIFPLADRASIDAWLDPRTSIDDARGLLVPLHAELMDTHEVTARVGSVAHDDPSLLQRIDTGPSTLFG